MMKSYQPGYPRPQFVRSADSWENLNGKWDFAFDDADEGITRAWFRSFPESRVICVPFTYETAKSGIGNTDPHGVVWYHRTILVEKNRRAGKRVMLHFEGSDYRTELWVNGNFAGVHDGAYARFSFDITRLLRDGQNEIAVRVEDSVENALDLSRPRGKQRWKHENFGCWYIQTTGIWKTVWLEYVPLEHIASLKMTPLLAEGKLVVEADIARHVSGPEDSVPLYIEAVVEFKGRRVALMRILVNKSRVEFAIDVVNTTINEWGIFTWAPEHPHLYDINFRLLREGSPVDTTLDTVLSYFGMRDIRIDGAMVLLNGTPLYQRLILDQGYWEDSHLTPPDEEALITDIDMAMAAGYNGVRKHQKTEDERFLYWADVKGLLVWSEMGAAYEFNESAVGHFTREWLEVVRQHYNHPSIIIWTPFNESWGVPGIKNNAAQQRFTEAVYHLTKSCDPCRPVITNDGWEHTVSDIITLHDYEEEGKDFFARYAAYLDAMLDNRVPHNRVRSVFAEGYGYRGQPVIISEFGGVAFNNGKGWGYGNKVNSKEEFVKRFDAITTAIKKIDRICGYCYTQLADVQQEVNGLLDPDRNFKADPVLLKEINERPQRGFQNPA
jgi:beta-galactosidase/beta-glucuronidase